MNTRIDLSSLTPEERELFELLAEQQGVDALAATMAPNEAPLSPTQERLWATAQLATEQTWGNVPLAFRMRGPLALARVQRSLDAVVRRHDVLRTVFPLVDGVRVQRVVDSQPITWTHRDFCDAPDPYQAALRDFCDQVREPFTLDRECGLRASCNIIGDEDVLIMVTVHHLVTDGWGIRVLLNDWSQAYTRPTDGEGIGDALEWQYADFARWQRTWLRSPEARRQAKFWREALDGAPRRLHLPFDRPRQGQPSFRADTVPVMFSPEMSERVRDFAKAQGVTVFVTLLAALQSLLHRYAHQDDVVIGTIFSVRSRREAEVMVGNFGNNVQVRVKFDGTTPFEGVIGAVRDAIVSAYANQEMPLEYIGSVPSGSDGGSSGVPLFQTMFVLRDSTLSENVQFPGVAVEAVAVPVGVSALDLTLDLSDGEEGIAGFLEFRQDLFDRSTIEVVRQDLHDLIELVVRQPQLPIESWQPTLVKQPPSPTQAPVSDSTERERFTDRERDVVNIWTSILGPMQISQQDNFFDLGGTSLQAMTVLDQLQKQFGVVIEPMDLGVRSLAQIAQLSEQLAYGAEPPKPPAGLLQALRTAFKKH